MEPILLCAGHRGGSLPFNRSLRYEHRPTVFGRLTNLKSLYGRSAPVLLAAFRADITHDPVYVCARCMYRTCQLS